MINIRVTNNVDSRRDRETPEIEFFYVVPDYFVDKWLARTRRRKLDVGDRFISLWIAFNGWMKGKFGENKKESDLLKKAKELPHLKSIFEELRSARPTFKSDLNKLSEVTVIDMRYSGQLIDISEHSKGRGRTHARYDGSFCSLIDVLYKIRCNLFHGRKDIQEDTKDIRLVELAYRILLPLFKTYITRYGCN